MTKNVGYIEYLGMSHTAFQLVNVWDYIKTIVPLGKREDG